MSANLTIGGLKELRTHCVESIRRTFSDHIPLYICAVVFLAATIVTVDWYHVPLPVEASAAFLRLVPTFVILLIAFGALAEFIALIRTGMPAKPGRAIGRKLLAGFVAGDRPGNAFHGLVTLTPLMICFAALKDEIPRIHPFAWDQTFMKWGLAIGHGVAPSAIIQHLIGYPLVTVALNLVYDSWFVVMFGCLFWQVFAARGSALRMQFLIAFAMCWFIAGNVVACIFSSAGPCFYGHIVPGADPYAAQMAYLHEVNRHWPVWSLQLQDVLWNSYVRGNGMVSGISAMPSMHVTIATLIASFSWRVDKRLGAAATLFAVLIFIGSIHLGWHYSIDAIAGVILAILFWDLAGWFVKFTTRVGQTASAVAEVPVQAPA